MLDEFLTPSVLGLPAGVMLAFLAYKLLWPTLSKFMELSATQSSAKNDTLEQISDQLYKALDQLDKERTRADNAVSQMSDMKATIAKLTYQVQIQGERIERLTKRINDLSGGKDASSFDDAH